MQPNHNPRRVRCMACDGCRLLSDCGECRECQDKLHFGGTGKRKKLCRARICGRLYPDREEEREETRAYKRPFTLISSQPPLFASHAAPGALMHQSSSVPALLPAEALTPSSGGLMPGPLPLTGSLASLLPVRPAGPAAWPARGGQAFPAAAPSFASSSARALPFPALHGQFAAGAHVSPLPLPPQHRPPPQPSPQPTPQPPPQPPPQPLRPQPQHPPPLAPLPAAAPGLMVTAANADKSMKWIVAPTALAVLEQVFSMERFPTRQLRASLAADLAVNPRQVQVWFQNRRQKLKKEGSRAAVAMSLPPATLGVVGEREGGPWQFVQRASPSAPMLSAVPHASSTTLAAGPQHQAAITALIERARTIGARLTAPSLNSSRLPMAMAMPPKTMAVPMAMAPQPRARNLAPEADGGDTGLLMLLAAAGMHSAPPSPPQDCGGRSSVVEAMPLALAAVAEKPMAAISGGLLFGAVGAAGVALSSLQSETLPILPIFFGCVCLCLAAFSVSNALLAGDKFARAWALVIPLHPLLLSAPLLLAHPDLLRATEILLGDRLPGIPGTVLVVAIGAVTATMPRPFRWKCAVMGGFLLTTVSNFVVVTYLLDERLSYLCTWILRAHPPAVASFAVALLGQYIMVRSAPKPPFA